MHHDHSKVPVADIGKFWTGSGLHDAYLTTMLPPILRTYNLDHHIYPYMKPKHNIQIKSEKDCGVVFAPIVLCMNIWIRYLSTSPAVIISQSEHTGSESCSDMLRSTSPGKSTTWQDHEMIRLREVGSLDPCDSRESR